jgi:hypothetical protein
MSVQPWLSSFQLPTKNIGNWADTRASEIEKAKFDCYDNGFDETFQETYTQLVGWSLGCLPTPSVWECRPWLQDIALPIIAESMSQTLVPVPVHGFPLQHGLRKQALNETFSAIAKAYLRTALFKAQRSDTKMQLTHDGSLILPKGALPDWAALQQMALDIEQERARVIVKERSDPHAQYQKLMSGAICLFAETYDSLARNISYSNADTAHTGNEKKKKKKKPSKDAYLHAAHSQHRLLEDDGIKHLAYKLARTHLEPHLKKLSLSDRDLKPQFNTDKMQRRRLAVVQEMYVHFHAAPIARGKGIDEIALLVCRHFSSARPSNCGRTAMRGVFGLYNEKAASAVRELIDRPTEVLKDVSKRAYGRDVWSTMDCRDFARDSPRGEVAEYTGKAVAPCSKLVVTLSPAKRRCCNASFRGGDEMQE